MPIPSSKSTEERLDEGGPSQVEEANSSQEEDQEQEQAEEQKV